MTFELYDLSIGSLWQPFEAHLTGQRQTHTATAQQKANLLAACILCSETTVRIVKTLGLVYKTETMIQKL